MRVHVLLFNARTENEGIHTIAMGGENYVLMFEDEDDATRYAMLLEAQDFGSPAVEPIDEADVKEFCASAGYESKFVPKDFRPSTPEERLMLAPPETNLEETDLSRQEKDPPSSSEAVADTSELDRIRSQLEKLL